jgi:hypothetical protein
MMEKRVTDKSNPLTIDMIRDDLNLRFARLNEKQNEESENDNNQEVAFFGGQFKGKCQNCGAIGHKKQRIANQKRAKMVVRIAEITTIFKNMQIMALTALIVAVEVTLKATVTK